MDVSIQSTDTTDDATAPTGTARRPKPARKPRSRKPGTRAAQADPASADAQSPRPPAQPAARPEPGGETRATQEECDQEPNDHAHSTPDGAEPEPCGEPGSSAGQGTAAGEEEADEKITDSATAQAETTDTAPGQSATADNGTADKATAETVSAETTATEDTAPEDASAEAATTQKASAENLSAETTSTEKIPAVTTSTDKAIDETGITASQTADHEPVEPAEPEKPSDAADPKAPALENESAREHETPIFAAMFAGWDGPAAGLIGRNLHRADAETMVFDAVMWRPGPDRKAPALRFQVSGERYAPVITASGELKAGSVALLTTPLQHILRRRPRQVIVDLAGITAVTPGALRALLDVRKAARAAHIDFWLRSPSDPVRELLRPAGSMEVRPKTPAVRRPADPRRNAAHGSRRATPDADEGTDSATEAQEDGARSKAQLIAGKLPGGHRRAAAQAKRVLEGVIVEKSGARPRPWWPSHALIESLRRVGSHHHPHGQSSPT